MNTNVKIGLNAHGCGVYKGWRCSNCAEAFAAAVKNGFTNIELDISKTKDGAYVASHNSDLVAELSLSEFYQRQQVGSVLTLDNVLAKVQENPKIVVMIDFHPGWKTDCPQDIIKIIERIRSYGVEERVLVETYSTNDANAAVSCQYKNCILWLLRRYGDCAPEEEVISEKVEFCLNKGIHYVSIGLGLELRSYEDQIRRLKGNGVCIYSRSASWERYSNLNKAHSLGVDVVTVDDLIPGGGMKNWYWRWKNRAYRLTRKLPFRIRDIGSWQRRLLRRAWSKTSAHS